MRLRRTLGITLGLVAVAAITMAYAQQPGAPAQNPTGPESLPAGGATAPSGANQKPLKERASYAIGVDLARGLKEQGLEIDAAVVARGLLDEFAGKTAIGEKEMHDTMVEFQTAVVTQRRKQAAELGEKNKKEGDAFLVANKNREGVKTLPSGLQYKILKQGNGAVPKATDTVTTNYRGTFIDGTEFDSSAKHGGAATFPVNGVIPGWTEALQLMHEGDKWQLVLPSNLAYGAHGAPPDIGPNATLVFDIELLKVAPGNATPARPAANPGAPQQ